MIQAPTNGDTQMAVDAARVTLNGALPCGEGWQASFIIQDTVGDHNTLVDYVDAADGFMQGLIDPTIGLMGQYDPLTSFGPAKVQMIDSTTGAGGARAVGSVSGVGTEGAAGGPLPPEVSVVITLRGKTPLQLTHGRFYLPAPLAVCGTSKGRIRSETQNKFANAIAQAATTMALAVTADMRMAIYSPTHNAVTVARRAEVGDVFDTQRSRRDKLVESRIPILIGEAF
jgi:hypothetical protein